MSVIKRRARYNAQMILRNFLYLNHVALDGYLAAVEDGLREELERERETSTHRTGGVKVKLVEGELGGAEQRTERLRSRDASEAKFNRLLITIDERPTDFEWIQIQDPNSDLPAAGPGVLIEGEAEFYIPSLVRSLSSEDGSLNNMLDMVDALAPLAGAFNLDMTGMPSRKERESLKVATQTLKAALVAVGELGEGEWKVAGQLDKEYIRGDIDGPARFVGKVSRTWSSNEGRHLLALPGATLLPRDERRRLERQRPEDANDDSFLMGPAVMMDILAIWR
jgi:hypothetical protein